MLINQGDIFWVQPENPSESEKEAIQGGFIGKEVDTTRLRSREAAEAIWQDVYRI